MFYIFLIYMGLSGVACEGRAGLFCIVGGVYSGSQIASLKAPVFYPE
jgi:hypothetical protein